MGNETLTQSLPQCTATLYLMGFGSAHRKWDLPLRCDVGLWKYSAGWSVCFCYL